MLDYLKYYIISMHHGTLNNNPNLPESIVSRVLYGGITLIIIPCKTSKSAIALYACAVQHSGWGLMANTVL